MRTPGGVALSWAVGADVESLAWNPHEAEQFVVSAEDGHVSYFDARAGGAKCGSQSSAAPSTIGMAAFSSLMTAQRSLH